MSLRDSSDGPSPYVTIRMSRKQAKEVERVVLWHATGLARSDIKWAALKRIRAALKENAR